MLDAACCMLHVACCMWRVHVVCVRLLAPNGWISLRSVPPQYTWAVPHTAPQAESAANVARAGGHVGEARGLVLDEGFGLQAGMRCSETHRPGLAESDTAFVEVGPAARQVAPSLVNATNSSVPSPESLVISRSLSSPEALVRLCGSAQITPLSPAEASIESSFEKDVMIGTVLNLTVRSFTPRAGSTTPTKMRTLGDSAASGSNIDEAGELLTVIDEMKKRIRLLEAEAAHRVANGLGFRDALKPPEITQSEKMAEVKMSDSHEGRKKDGVVVSSPSNLAPGAGLASSPSNSARGWSAEKRISKPSVAFADSPRKMAKSTPVRPLSSYFKVEKQNGSEELERSSPNIGVGSTGQGRHVHQRTVSSRANVDEPWSPPTQWHTLLRTSSPVSSHVRHSPRLATSSELAEPKTSPKSPELKNLTPKQSRRHTPSFGTGVGIERSRNPADSPTFSNSPNSPPKHAFPAFGSRVGTQRTPPSRKGRSGSVWIGDLVGGPERHATEASPTGSQHSITAHPAGKQ